MTVAAHTSSLLGLWEVDPIHSTVEFRVRHAGVARVRGVFEEFEGALHLAESGEARAHGLVQAASLNTRVEARDRHLRSSDFFEVERHPHISFTSTSVELAAGGELVVHGDLTIRGVTREVVLEGEIVGRGYDDDGAERVGLELSTRLDRRDYGLTWNAAVDGGGVLVGNRVDVVVEISAVRSASGRTSAG